MQRRSIVLALASLAATVLLGCATKDGAADPGAALKPLTVDQVATRLAAHDGHTFVFDDNPKEVYVKGHVPTAVWLDEVNAAALPKDKAATLIFYCHNES
jgi:hypothetical protein